MLEIVALSPADGWAVVRQRDRLSLVQPPYSAADQRRVDEAFLEKALCQLGFELPQEPLRFLSWAPLIECLNHQVAVTRAERGHAIDDPRLGEELLRVAPASVLRGFLARTETELLPDPVAWEGAKRLLITILKLPTVRETHDLHYQTVDLLQRLLEEERRREHALQKVSTNLETLFPRITERTGVDRLREFMTAFADQSAPMGIS
jgi:hypothetical protein